MLKEGKNILRSNLPLRQCILSLIIIYLFKFEGFNIRMISDYIFLMF